MLLEGMQPILHSVINLISGLRESSQMRLTIINKIISQGVAHLREHPKPLL
jgi:hypothetical protein